MNGKFAKIIVGNLTQSVLLGNVSNAQFSKALFMAVFTSSYIAFKVSNYLVQYVLEICWLSAFLRI